MRKIVYNVSVIKLIIILGIDCQMQVIHFFLKQFFVEIFAKIYENF